MSTVLPARAPALPPRAAVRARTHEFATLLSLLTQLTLVLLVVHAFQLESRTFFAMLTVAVAGFGIHAALPLGWRLPFFVLLSFAGIGVAMGLRDGALLVATGLVLIGICHLPLGIRTRLALLATAGITLAAARAGLLPAPWSGVVWPILASMFMFRLAVYVYTLRYTRLRPTPWQSLGYFFMLPNVCFPLFPVVDYTTFAQSHYSVDPARTYRRGTVWIVRGLVHLLLYRYVYLVLVKDPAAAADLGDVVQYLLSTFLLYLRVSGQFHIIVGLLHLYGFHLPETHRLYFLASSFTDFWRRINIYWKDFMMKLVYYPAFFRLRARGERFALVVSTVIVFLVTWLLHSYQWFWLRAEFPITLQDGLFWGILGVLVVMATMRELRKGRRRIRQTGGWSARRAAGTVGTFAVICILWSLWSAGDLGEWLSIWPAALHADAGDVVLLVALLGVGFAIAGRNWDQPLASRQEDGIWTRADLRNVAFLVGLLLLAQPGVHVRAGPAATSLAQTLSSNTLNARDAALEHRGYYENLDNSSRLSAAMWEAQARKPADWVKIKETAAYRARSDFLLEDLQPLTSFTFKGQRFSVNRFSLRDREYTIAKPPGWSRIAVVGPSLVLGPGLGDGEPFEAVLEERWNAAAPATRPAGNWQWLNFGYPDFSIVQQMAIIDERVLPFAPDVVMIALPDWPRVQRPLVTHLVNVLAAGIEIPYPGLRDILLQHGATPQNPAARPVPSARLRELLAGAGLATRAPAWELRRAVTTAAPEIAHWALGSIADSVRAHGATPLLLQVDLVLDSMPQEISIVAAARQAGFGVINLLDAYEGHDPATLRLGEWDKHPNALGHRLLADRLEAALLKEPGLLGAFVPTGAHSGAPPALDAALP